MSVPFAPKPGISGIFGRMESAPGNEREAWPKFLVQNEAKFSRVFSEVIHAVVITSAESVIRRFSERADCLLLFSSFPVKSSEPIIRQSAVEENKGKCYFIPARIGNFIDLSVKLFNRPFFSCVLSDLALGWKRGWGDLVLIQTPTAFHIHNTDSRLIPTAEVTSLIE